MIGSIISAIFNFSNLTWTTLVLVLTVCMLVQRLLLTRSNSHMNLPPAPRISLPIIGHLYLLQPDLRDPLRKFRKDLGNIYSLQFGNRFCVVMSGFETIKDALVKHGDDFLDRPRLMILEKIARGAGLVSVNGAKWKEHRRFTLTTLKDFGMGRSILEEKIHEEIGMFLEAVTAKEGQPFDPKYLIQTNVANIICSMIFGSTFKHGDEKFKEMVNGFTENARYGAVAGMLNFLPILEWIPGDLFKLKRLMQNSNSIFVFIEDIIEEHKKNYDVNNISDYTGAYLKQLDNLEKSGTQTTFNVKQLAATVGDLFVAGSETTSTTLLWAFGLLASYPDIQKEMFDEITKHIGKSRLPTLQDKTNLVYVEAVYMEVLRFANITFSGLPREASRDLKLHGFDIPSGTMILIDMDSVLNDPDIWTDPENFRPSRFIDDFGRLRKTDEFISFSLGKRNCAGESLARMELLLFLSAIVQQFELTCPEGADLSMSTIDGDFGTIHSPKPYEIIFRKRNV